MSTLQRIEKDLLRGHFITAHEDNGSTHGNITQTFWYINALTAVDRRKEARELFENMLKV